MTKESILQHLNPTDIFLHYLQLSKFPTGNISSPFSDDTKPSFKLYKNGTFKCFSSGKQGDAFQFVADLNKMDCRKNFNQVVNHIAASFNLSTTNQKFQAPTLKPLAATIKPQVPKEIDYSEHFQIKTIELAALHFNYYNQFGVSPEVLKAFDVKSVKSFQFYNKSKEQVQKFPIYDGVVSFAYEVNGNFEIYIPAQKHNNKPVSKFFYNGLKADDIFGFKQIPANCENLIIAAGKKDCLVLNAHGYNSVSFRSENHYPTEAHINSLKAKCKNLFICYDNDFEKTNNPGQTAMQKICVAFDTIPIYLPDGINDVAELYYKGSTIDESFINSQEGNYSKQEQESADLEAKKTIFHITENYLTAHYKIRFNSIKLDIECCPKGSNVWKSINENSLFIEMQKKGINISIDKLVAILKSDYTPQFNPVVKYFNELPKWTNAEPDFIAKLASFVKAKEPQQFLHHFKKWLARSVKCATIPDYFNKQALVFVSPTQNDGKSTFCRFLCPPALSEYIAEDISNDKDARILLCKNFLINLDELAVLSKQEINSLKAFFSKTQINERLPYDRKNSIISRIASFIGSTNQDEFLADETGSVRWLCFSISSINWEYKKEIDINKVWAQAVALANDEKFDCELTRDDIIENEKRNRDFQIVSIERELINKAFSVPTDGNYSQSQFLTSTEIMQHLIATEIIPSKGITKVAVGRAMKQEGYEREKEGGIYGYRVVPLKHSTVARIESFKPYVPPEVAAVLEQTEMPI